MYRSRSLTSRQAASAAAVAVVLAMAAGHAHAQASDRHHGRHGDSGVSAGTEQAIDYARHQLGKPYCWGGTGPSCYDCSGLTMEAWASAGRSIPRTSEEQWAGLRHVPASQRAAGDLVLAPGADGSWSSPGHVAILIGRDTVIQAYGTGYPIAATSLANFSAGAGGIVGYAAVK